MVPSSVSKEHSVSVEFFGIRKIRIGPDCHSDDECAHFGHANASPVNYMYGTVDDRAAGDAHYCCHAVYCPQSWRRITADPARCWACDRLPPAGWGHRNRTAHHLGNYSSTPAIFSGCAYANDGFPPRNASRGNACYSVGFYLLIRHWFPHQLDGSADFTGVGRGAGSCFISHRRGRRHHCQAQWRLAPHHYSA